MVTVVLDIADNGVVKVLEDDKINGGGETFISKILYNFDEDPEYKHRIKFLKELCLDIGLQTGNDITKRKLNFTVSKGAEAPPTAAQLRVKISTTLALLVKYKNELKQMEKDEVKG